MARIANADEIKAEGEIEITPEMIEAGAAAIFRYREEMMAWTLAEEVYRAMEQAKEDPKKDGLMTSQSRVQPSTISA